MQTVTQGALYVVATPIGNMDDISLRALSVLRQVDRVCAEDTRHTRQLLAHHGIDRPLLALHDHNESERIPLLLARLAAGEALALVSDAGTPLISDPGFPLVRAAREAGHAVHPVPGACAAIAALSVAGLPCERFCFEGFLPAKAGARGQRLAALAAESRTLVFYESAHRIVESVAAMTEAFGGDRPAVLARELTKLFETVISDRLDGLGARLASDGNQRKGEFVVIVAGAPEPESRQLQEGRRLYRGLLEHLPPSQAARIAAELSGAPRKALYGSDG
jgi:16S rRNA (cytidine1402-2'-O)-methyltransferase